jgi:hypothetical protein
MNEGKFNPLDPLGVVKTVKDQVDTMVVKAGLPSPPNLPGMGQRTEAERETLHRERYGGIEPPPRGTGMNRWFDPLGLFNRKQ